jgi:hypothetical protein
VTPTAEKLTFRWKSQPQRTCPRKQIDPTSVPYLSIASESIEVIIVQPALGPSLGVAPAGTWRWSRESRKKLLSGCACRRRPRATVSAMDVLSFMTSPSCPVTVMLPLFSPDSITLQKKVEGVDFAMNQTLCWKDENAHTYQLFYWPTRHSHILTNQPNQDPSISIICLLQALGRSFGVSSGLDNGA